jgi:hypothetical protein
MSESERWPQKEAVSRLLVGLSEDGPYTNPWANSIYQTYVASRRETAREIIENVVGLTAKLCSFGDKPYNNDAAKFAFGNELCEKMVQQIRARYGVSDE